MIQRRTDVLKCLLTCFSSSVYAPPERYLDTPNRWLDEFTRNRELFPPTFFYSLLNVSCSYDPIGWGLPYNYLLFSDLQEPLTDCALQLLAVLLDHSSLRMPELALSLSLSRSLFHARACVYLPDNRCID